MEDNLKVLNLYAGIGGNRFLWDNCEVTAVEIVPELAELYAKRFPLDNVVVGDAHQYLINNYKNFDFIWSSPPCPTHSKSRYWAYRYKIPVYPDMALYQEIIFLQHHCVAGQKWVIENVPPYYDLLIPATKVGRHLFWANFAININGYKDLTGRMIIDSDVKNLIKYHSIESLDLKAVPNKLKTLRNLVDYRLGKHILNCAIKKNSLNLFEI